MYGVLTYMILILVRVPPTLEFSWVLKQISSCKTNIIASFEDGMAREITLSPTLF